LTDTLDLAVIGNSAGRVWSGHAVLAVRLVFAAALVPFASAVPAAAMTLEVEASTTPPGFHRGDLLRYLVRHMAETKLADWRFEPAANSDARSVTLASSLLFGTISSTSRHCTARLPLMPSSMVQK